VYVAGGQTHQQAAARALTQYWSTSELARADLQYRWNVRWQPGDWLTPPQQLHRENETSCTKEAVGVPAVRCGH
jgi:hypothetical protein